MRSPRFPILAGAAVSAVLLLGAAPLTFADAPSAPISAGTATVSGNSLSDDQGAIVSTTSAEYFGTNQQAASAGANTLWWAVAIAGLAIIALAWLGYREL